VAVTSGGATDRLTDADLQSYERVLQARPDDLRAGNDYRMAVIHAGEYDRALAFFEGLVAAHPAAANAHLNYGFAYVDKIPVAGSITQVLLANRALEEFTKSLELRPSWVGYYTRGNSYLFWPRIFKRTHLGVADLERALQIQRAEAKRPYHARTFVALGDGFWKLDEFEKAMAAWRAGLAVFADDSALKARLTRQGDELKAVIESTYDPTRRVDSSLQDLWADR